MYASPHNRIPSFPFHSYSFSSVTEDILEERLCVKPGGLVLLLKSDLDARTEKASLLGQDHIWSSENSIKHVFG